MMKQNVAEQKINRTKMSDTEAEKNKVVQK